MKYVNKDIQLIYPILVKKGNSVIKSYKVTTSAGIYFKDSFNYLESIGRGIKFYNHGIEVCCDYDLINRFEDYVNVGSSGDLQSIIEVFSRSHPIIKWFLKTLINEGVSLYDEIEGFDIQRYREEEDYIAYSIDFKRFGILTLMVNNDDEYNYIIQLKRQGQCFYYSTLRSSAIVNKFLIKIKCIRNLLYRLEGEDIVEVIKKLRDAENV